MTDILKARGGVEMIDINVSWEVGPEWPQLNPNTAYVLKMRFAGFPTDEHARKFSQLIHDLLRQVDFKRFLSTGEGPN